MLFCPCGHSKPIYLCSTAAYSRVMCRAEFPDLVHVIVDSICLPTNSMGEPPHRRQRCFKIRRLVSVCPSTCFAEVVFLNLSATDWFWELEGSRFVGGAWHPKNIAMFCHTPLSQWSCEFLAKNRNKCLSSKISKHEAVYSLSDQTAKRVQVDQYHSHRNSPTKQMWFNRIPSAD